MPLPKKVLSRLLAWRPAILKSTTILAGFSCQTGREQRSLSYFNVAIKSPLYATPSMPNTNAGICLLRLKDDKGAEDYFMRALRLDPKNPKAILFLADIGYRQGRLAAARLHLAELHKLVEPSSESLWLAVRIERKLAIGRPRFNLLRNCSASFREVLSS